MYKNEDLETLSALFYDTVHNVNAGDYSPAQLFVWANNRDALKNRRADFSAQKTLVAEINGLIVGFGSIDKNGYLDMLFVHKDYQKQGIATALCNELEACFQTIKTHASITAEPFFENRGYTVVKSQEVVRRGVKLKNYEMIKG